MELMNAIRISASGMEAQGTRLRIVAENVANADSLGDTPEDNPYRRQTVTFKEVLDRDIGAHLVSVSKIGKDMSDFDMRYEPSHPLADEAGYIKEPNVNALIEMTDMKEAQRSYEANLSVIESSKSMIQRTIELIRR